MLILKTLGPGRMHGLGISQKLAQTTRGTFGVQPGSLFPALHRMQEEGWVESSWGVSENNRRAKYYELTKAGVDQLETEVKNWRHISDAIGRALQSRQVTVGWAQSAREKRLRREKRFHSRREEPVV